MSVTIPAVLPPEHYLRLIKIQEGGIRALTHLAMVRGTSGQPQRAYVKQFPHIAPRSLFNEWFGYIFMSAMGVPQPESGVLLAPVPGQARSAWAFVSFEPMPRNEGTPKEIYNLTDERHAQLLTARLLACQGFALLNAADQLCINGDRNIGNLVFTGPRSFVAIDHSDILGGYDWKLDSLLCPTTWASAKLIELCQAVKPLLPSQRDSLVAAADVAIEALYLQWKPLRDALQDNRESCIALDAVWWRSLSVAQWYRDKLQLLV